jgi:hypothetical protein
VHDYFNYFTEIEERFCQRRGTVVLLSTLDWALIETWKNAGVPLEAVLRGIDAAFDRYDARPKKTRKVNSLAYCAQEVLAAAEQMQAAALGTAAGAEKRESGFEAPQIAAYLQNNAAQLEALLPAANARARPSVPANPASSLPLPRAVSPLVQDAIGSLRDLARGLITTQFTRLEDLERRLTVMEEKLFAGLLAATPDEQIVAVRAEADRELAPYRRNMSAPQIEQLQKQYLHKRLLERYGLPRLSLFYM